MSRHEKVRYWIDFSIFSSSSAKNDIKYAWSDKI